MSTCSHDHDHEHADHDHNHKHDCGHDHHDHSHDQKKYFNGPAIVQVWLSLLPWILLLVAVLVREDTQFFIASWQGPLTYTGLVVLLLIGILATKLFSVKKNKKQSWATMNWTRTLICWMPFYAYVAVEPKILEVSNDAVFFPELPEVSFQSHGSPGFEMGGFNAGEEPSPEYLLALENQNLPEPINADSRSLTVLKANSLEERVTGGQVSVIGRFITPAEPQLTRIQNGLPERGIEAVLYRHVMTCCAADAQPMYVYLSNLEDRHVFKDHEWIQIDGLLRDTAAHLPVQVHIQNIKAIEEPVSPYELMNPMGGFKWH